MFDDCPVCLKHILDTDAELVTFSADDVNMFVVLALAALIKEVCDKNKYWEQNPQKLVPDAGCSKQ